MLSGRISMPHYYPENGHVPHGSLPPKGLGELVTTYTAMSPANLGYREFVTIVNPSGRTSGDFLRRLRLALAEQGKPTTLTLVSTNDHHYDREITHAVQGYPETDYKRKATRRDWRIGDDRHLLRLRDGAEHIVFAALERDIDMEATLELAERASMLVLSEAGVQIGDFPLEWLPDNLATFQFIPHDERLRPLSTGLAAQGDFEAMTASQSWTSSIMVNEALIEARRLGALAATSG